jgi:hypothetical protein
VNSTRRTSITTGTLLIIATIAALAASVLEPALTGTDFLQDVADHPNRLAAAALLNLIAAGTSVGIAIALYPILKRINAALALGSVVFRTVEAVFYTAAVVSLLSILPLGQQLTTAAPDQHAPIHAIAGSLLSMRDHSTLAGVFAFNLGAVMYYALFYREQLVPRWLSGWGIAAALLMMTACLLALFSRSPVTGYTLLIPPIAVLRGRQVLSRSDSPARCVAPRRLRVWSRTPAERSDGGDLSQRRRPRRDGNTSPRCDETLTLEPCLPG